MASELSGKQDVRPSIRVSCYNLHYDSFRETERISHGTGIEFKEGSFIISSEALVRHQIPLWSQTSDV